MDKLPMSLFGLNIIEHKPRFEQKIKLRDDLPVSDQFRAEFNKWLLDMFGMREISLLPPGTVFMFQRNLVMRPEHIAMLTNYI